MVGLTQQDCSRPNNMKMITEYLDHAITFERMEAEEDDAVLKAKFEKQAIAYRKLAPNELLNTVPCPARLNQSIKSIEAKLERSGRAFTTKQITSRSR
jgi:hypothetical protein